MNLVCFIPSKNRPNTKTYKLFEKNNIKVYHFLEPQDLDNYQVPNKININQNDKGVSFVRNFMLEFAKKNSYEWVIFCDDDVSSFGKYENGKTVKKDTSIWLEVFEKAKELPFEIIGINYCQHAWHEKKSYSINRKFAEVCILMNTTNIYWKYKENTKEDRDFQLQTIQKGQGVLRFNHYWFQCPDVGTNAGGLYDLYKQKKDTQWAKKIVEDWHPFAKFQKKGNRIDAKIDLKGFAEFHKKNVK